MKDPAGNPISGALQDNGWYSGYNYYQGQWSSRPGEFAPNNPHGSGIVSQEVVQQTNPNNWNYIQSQNVQAGNIQAPTTTPTTSGGISQEVERANKELQAILQKQFQTTQQQVTETKATQKEALDSFKSAATGMREDIEGFASEIEPYILEDFQARRNAVNRLEQLLTEGQEYINQQKTVTGLSAIRNPRINKAIEDVAAEAGIIQAYIAGLDGNIATAHEIINNKMGVIVTARKEEIDYYKTIIQLSENNLIRLDSDLKRIAEAEIRTGQAFLDNALAVQRSIMEMLADPARAPLMQGVRLNMSIEEINATIANNAYRKDVWDQASDMAKQGYQPVSDPSGIPSSQLVTLTDSRGVQHHYKKTSASGTGQSTNDALTILRSVTTSGSGGSFANQEQPPGTFNDTVSVGDRFVNPQTGSVWIYYSTGWRRIL